MRTEGHQRRPDAARLEAANQLDGQASVTLQLGRVHGGCGFGADQGAVELEELLSVGLDEVR